MAEKRQSPDDWRRLSCLGCTETVKRNRDSWVEVVGSRSGTWILAIGTSAGRMTGDAYPPPSGMELFLLGVAHLKCLDLTRGRLRNQEVELADWLPSVVLDEDRSEESLGDVHLPTRLGTCPFCQNYVGRSTDEDIFPLWLLRELQNRGARARQGDKILKRLPRVTVAVCSDCNNRWMSTLENDTKELMLSLIDHRRPISPAEQSLLALWATKMAILFDVYTGSPVLPRGFGHDLRIRRQPHHGSFVWMAAAAELSNVLAVEPRLIYADDSDEVIAFCVTFAIVRVAFQVFIPINEGDLAPLNDFQKSIVRIWPPTGELIDWSPTYYLDDAAFKAYSIRAYDGREPVTTTVTLKATQILPGPSTSTEPQTASTQP